ncbi:MAG: hypothetical protein DWQ01_14675 [Planctomycetota bacterium]|nr:MAG: hypothetical protein DWQ01_14675 [Planctomycetota bacterium]
MAWTSLEILLLCAAVNGPTTAPQGPVELTLPRTPALSPDGSRVAFSHQGDLWVAPVATGKAVRLTAHPAYESDPKWSPDGQWLAFLSARHGNRDVFVISVEGGLPKRLTWHSESENLHGWLDNDRVLLGAQRDRRYSRRDQGAWVAYRDGRTPTVLGDWAMMRPALSGDGRWLCYERGHGDPRRRAYRGPASSALWLFDFVRKEHRALTEFDGNDLDPMWSQDAGWVYFLSDRACAGNEEGRDLGLWKIPRGGGQAQLVYHPGGRSLRYAEISLNGRWVVAELEASLLLINTRSGEARPLRVYGSWDPATPREMEVTVQSGASDLAVSPDGESIAFSSGGDVFVMRKHEKIHRARRITEHPAPDYGPIWVDDGKALLFLSERDGNAEVYRVRASGEEEPLYKFSGLVMGRVTETEFDEADLQLAPDGKALAWVQGPGRLVVGDPGSMEVRRVITDGFEGPEFAWSPDSRWLAYSQVNDDFNYDVFLALACGEGVEAGSPGLKPFNLTRHPDDDTSPRWSPDGRYLAFTSRRRMLDETDVWMALLHKEDAEINELERLELEEAREKAKKAKKKGAAKGKSEPGAEPKSKSGKTEPEPPAAADPAKPVDPATPEPKADPAGAAPQADSDGDEKEKKEEEQKEAVEPIRIDFDELPLRLRRITQSEGNESCLGWGEDGKTLYFNASVGTRLTVGSNGQRGFFSVDVHDGKPKELESSPVGSWTRHEKEILYTKSGKIYGRTSKAVPYPFSVRFRRDQLQHRVAVLEQGWRALDRNFYDPGFHGHDWKASLEKWRPLATQASTPEDFSLFMNWMLGEMNASHMGYFGGGTSSASVTDRHSTGFLGVLWDESYSGPGRKVQEVLENQPAHRELSQLSAGDVVLAVNGEAYQSGDNWHRLMLGTVNQETELTVRNSEGEERRVTLRPTSWNGMNRGLYDRAVKNARRQVEASSQSRLGYIHILGMGTTSLLEFERDLFRAAHDKDALLIDVRENGGGWTTDMVLAMLMVKDHAITVPRGGGPGYPQGRRIFATWDKPVVVLCNENSYSNAEIFSWSIKTLGRGPVVGKKTFGAVISTGGTGLLDGSFVRLPFRGWYVNNPERTNMELNGCPPDYPVENLPGDFVVGKDRQLEKAIEVGLQLLDS